MIWARHEGVGNAISCRTLESLGKEKNECILTCRDIIKYLQLAGLIMKIALCIFICPILCVNIIVSSRLYIVEKPS